ncbi:MAG: chorismate synthase [Halanaerobiales bacterium]|nr:chorismate synthase [Halanaerobiales bacterium]
MLNFHTAGESHGKALMSIVEGLPADIEVDVNIINDYLERRQQGYGRGNRMKIEKDKVEIISGIRNGKTIGTPVGMMIKNKDWKNWKEIMDIYNIDIDDEVTKPRPGHADLAGVFKYGQKDIRNILERASARETAARVAVGGLLYNFLKYFDINLISHVIQIGSISIDKTIDNIEDIQKIIKSSKLNCIDQNKEKEMVDLINKVKKEGNSLGGIVEIRTNRMIPGLGSHSTWNKRLDQSISAAMMSIPSVKGVEIGNAFSNAVKKGSKVHDEIYYNDDKGYYRKTNNAGGIEGGITNGEPLVIRLAVKPIPTLSKPLKTVDIKTKKQEEAFKERADVTVVPSVGVIGEAMLIYILSKKILIKFGGDNIKETVRNYKNYINNL